MAVKMTMNWLRRLIMLSSIGCVIMCPVDCFGSNTDRLFPLNLARKDWATFRAAGFSKPVCGVVYRLKDDVPCGMPLGGVDTGCIDLETSGLWGYCTIFNTHVPRRGPMNLPILGLSVGGETWVLCDKRSKQVELATYQACADYPASGLGPTGYPKALIPDYLASQGLPIAEPYLRELKLEGVKTAKEIHYWGHYPVADMEFETDAPVSVGLRAWVPFLPGDVVGSMIPGAVFEVHLRNTSKSGQRGALAFSFPGPTALESGTDRFPRKEINEDIKGISVTTEKASYVLGVVGEKQPRLGGELGSNGLAWAKIADSLPDAQPDQPGSSVAVDFSLKPGESKIVRYVLTWYSPEWKGGGKPWATAGSTLTHMYAKHYPNAEKTAQLLAKDHQSLLKRTLAWQQVIYTDSKLPVWLRDSLINVLYMITEDGMWAQAKTPLPEWVKPEDGLFGMIECPRACAQIECIPCSFYGNQPLVYLFPELALSTLRGYNNYQFPEGAAPWIFGGATASTPPVDFAFPERGYQTTTNGICLASMVDRYVSCYDDKQKSLLKEFYPAVKQNAMFTMNLRTTPSYSIGQRIISMPDGNEGTEWFEVPEPGWRGMVSHAGGLHLAQLRIAEKMAEATGDKDFADQCRAWLRAGMGAMERNLWNGNYYLNYNEPDTNSKSDLVFAYQLDGEWVTRFHGLRGVFPPARVETTLDTIERCNAAIGIAGPVNYANADGTAAAVGGYGKYGVFVPEVVMLGMLYMYEGRQEFGLKLVEKCWRNLQCTWGFTWDQPDMVSKDVNNGERTGAHDYYQNMMLWSLPAALDGAELSSPVKPGGLVDRIIRAAKSK
ncbi:MAG: GH116 family glycosyl-hydrolase [Armatimonadota bacterium]